MRMVTDVIEDARMHKQTKCTPLQKQWNTPCRIAAGIQNQHVFPQHMGSISAVVAPCS